MKKENEDLVVYLDDDDIEEFKENEKEKKRWMKATGKTYKDLYNEAIFNEAMDY